MKKILLILSVTLLFLTTACQDLVVLPNDDTDVVELVELAGEDIIYGVSPIEYIEHFQEAADTTQPHYFTITGEVLSVMGILDDDNTIPAFADFTKINIKDDDGNIVRIISVGWAGNVGTLNFGAITVGEPIKAFIPVNEHIGASDLPTYIALAIVGALDDVNLQIGWFSACEQEGYAIIDDNSFAFKVDVHTVFVRAQPPYFASDMSVDDWHRHVRYHTESMGLAIIYSDLSSGNIDRATASKVFSLNNEISRLLSNAEEFDSLISVLLSSLSLTQFTILPLPITVNGIMVESLPTVIKDNGTVMVPYTAVTSFLNYGVSRLMYGEKLRLNSGDGSMFASLNLTVGKTVAVLGGGRNVHLCTPLILIDGVIYAPLLSLYRMGAMPVTNAHITETRIEIYNMEHFIQGSSLGRWNQPFYLSVEEAAAMSISVNGQTIANSSVILTHHEGMGSPFLMVRLEPILQALGSYQAEWQADNGAVIVLNMETQEEYRYFGSNGFVPPIISDEQLYVPLFSFFRDWFTGGQNTTNTFVYESRIEIYTLDNN